MAKNRDYSSSDVDMLMASRKIAQSFVSNLASLAAARTDWTPDYADGLIVRIDTALSMLGVDPKKELRSATATITGIETPAKNDLAFFKTQISDDFKTEPSFLQETLKILGFTEHLTKVQKGNQQSLIELLYTFQTNMTPDLRSKILSKGMNGNLIDRLTDYSGTLKNANVNQETLKSSSKEVTKEVADTFNAIYNEIIGICKKVSKFFKDDPLKKEQFTFSKAVKQLGEPIKKDKSTAKTPVA